MTIDICHGFIGNLGRPVSISRVACRLLIWSTVGHRQSFVTRDHDRMLCDTLMETRQLRRRVRLATSPLADCVVYGNPGSLTRSSRSSRTQPLRQRAARQVERSLVCATSMLSSLPLVHLAEAAASGLLCHWLLTA